LGNDDEDCIPNGGNLNGHDNNNNNNGHESDANSLNGNSMSGSNNGGNSLSGDSNNSQSSGNSGNGIGGGDLANSGGNGININGNGGNSNGNSGTGSDSGSMVDMKKLLCKSDSYQTTAKCIYTECKKSITCQDEMIATNCKDKLRALEIEVCIRDLRAEINRLDAMDKISGNMGERKARFLFVRF
jgi:hypothetical protein